MYAIADCNNFFVSCERVFRPDLRERPVVVLSGNDGCVVSRSNEAKRLGIPMGIPLHEIEDLVREQGVTCFSSNFPLYGDLSNRVMRILSAHTPRFEQYSIDEAFLDISHLSPDQRKPVCESIVDYILRGVGIPVSIGIAPSKTLAKIASKYAKQYPGYHGVCCITDDLSRLKALASFPIGDVWGIGRQTRAKCLKMGVETALDFANMGEQTVRKLFHLPGWKTWRELNSFDEITLAEMTEKQSITQSRTFASQISDKAVIEKYLADFASSCAEKLRRQHSACRQLAYFVETSRFRTDELQHVIYRTITLPLATSLTSELLSFLLADFRRSFRPGYPYKRAGVILLSISSDNGVQQVLFDDRNRRRDERLQQAIDNVNSRYGRRTLVVGTQVDSSQTDRLLRSDNLSPRYTTDLRDIITLKC